MLEVGYENEENPPRKYRMEEKNGVKNDEKFLKSVKMSNIKLL